MNEIQRALDWLREKRVSDAWENDTHMVILAKEVSERGEGIKVFNGVEIFSLYVEHSTAFEYSRS